MTPETRKFGPQIQTIIVPGLYVDGGPLMVDIHTTRVKSAPGADYQTILPHKKAKVVLPDTSNKQSPNMDELRLMKPTMEGAQKVLEIHFNQLVKGTLTHEETDLKRRLGIYNDLVSSYTLQFGDLGYQVIKTSEAQD